MDNIPQTHTYYEHLTLAGLSPQQALIYESLIKTGARAASKIARDVHIERVIAYRVLDQLIELNLVIKKDEPGKVAAFEAAHPSRLETLADQKEKEAKTAKESLKAVLPELSSTYNLSIGKPGVRFYEGIEGIKEVAFDNLSAKTEILAYVDMANINKYLAKMNEEYVKVRRRLRVQKKNLVNDTPENRSILASYNRDITEIRLLTKAEPLSFASMMQIYDDKISYITLDPSRYIGIIIQDAHIAEMHRQLYLYTWDTALQLNKQAPHPIDETSRSTTLTTTA